MDNIVPRNTTGHGRGGVVHFVEKFKQESTFHRKVRIVFVDKRLIAKIHIYPTDFRLNRKRRFSRYCRNLRIVHRKQKEEYVENAIPPCYKEYN